MSREAGRRRRRGLPIARSSCEALHTEGARRGAVYASAGLACWQKLKRKDTYDTYVCMRAHTHAHIRAHVKVHARACISASTWHISQPRFYHCTSRVDIFLPFNYSDWCTACSRTPRRFNSILCGYHYFFFLCN